MHLVELGKAAGEGDSQRDCDVVLLAPAETVDRHVVIPIADAGEYSGIIHSRLRFATPLFAPLFRTVPPYPAHPFRGW